MKRRFFLAGILAAPVVAAAAPVAAKAMAPVAKETPWEFFNPPVAKPRVVPDKLAVFQTDALAQRMRPLLNLGDDWVAVGQGAALTGRRFNRIVLFSVPRYDRWTTEVAFARLAPGGDWQVL